MATRSGTTVYWSSYNYPTGVSTATESATFQYAWDRQRWQTVYSGSAGTETTYHAGKNLEKVVSGGNLDYRHYVFAGNELVAIVSRQSSGTNTVRYVLEDHQGSISAIITDSNPGPVSDYVSESFTAYGNRRSGETWSGAPSSSDENSINAVSRWGYTGQTTLGVSMGLIHMDGRVADAITGRFLSPDPNIPQPDNTQSWNRYSYVNNNPLTMTDPSGFQSNANCSGTYCPGDNNVHSGLGGVASGSGPQGIPDNVDSFVFDQGAGLPGTDDDLASLTTWFEAYGNAINHQLAAANGDTGGDSSLLAQSQIGLGLSESQWSQLSQLVDGAQPLTPLADPSSPDQPAVPGAATPDQIQKANDAWDNFEDATQQGNQGDADYWLRQYYTYCGCSAGPADSGGPPYSPPRPNPTPTPPSYVPPTLPSPPITVPAPSL